MPVVRARPNEYLLVGRKGALENRGSAVQAILLPGAIYVLIPSSKQEATFEFTQETKDGIPLRFKGIIIYRITDPAAAARLFDFSDEAGIGQITTLLTHICLGELRHAVSHMTMVECIEQRKTTLSGVVEAALQQTIHNDHGEANEWGITVEVAQLAQVFIVDAQLRQQLEAEVRNEIKLKSDQSDIRSKEEVRLTEMASAARVEEKKLAADLDVLRREQQKARTELALAEERTNEEIASESRLQQQRLAASLETMRRDQEKVRTQLALEEEEINTETPVRLLKVERERDVLQQELAMRTVQNQVKELEVEGNLLLERAKQELRRQMLPLEQAPGIVESASQVLRGANLSIYGESSQLLGQLAPIFDLLTRAVQQATQGGVQPTSEGAERA